MTEITELREKALQSYEASCARRKAEERKAFEDARMKRVMHFQGRLKTALGIKIAATDERVEIDGITFTMGKEFGWPLRASLPCLETGCLNHRTHTIGNLADLGSFLAGNSDHHTHYFGEACEIAPAVVAPAPPPLPITTAELLVEAIREIAREEIENA